MQKNTAVNFAPFVSDDKKLDVSVLEDGAVIRLSTWTEGLGWCGQKTLAIDAEMLDELHTVLMAARLRLRCSSRSDGAAEQFSKVLSFPRFD